MERYLAGESCREIAETYQVDSEVVRMRLKRWGVTRRVGTVRQEKHPSWKGGSSRRREEDRDMHYYRRQSYEVAAICLGQPVPPGMVIHHVDEDWHNNQPENLVLFPSQSVHARFHQLLIARQREDPGVDATRLALENGGRALPKPRAPIQLPLGKGQRGPSGIPPSPVPVPAA